MRYELDYDGRLAATLDHGRVTYSEAIGALERDHPVRRFVAAMCLYLVDVHERLTPAPPTADAAAFYARMLLIPLRDLLQRITLPDAELAEFFNVPLAEISLRRCDVELIASMPS